MARRSATLVRSRANRIVVAMSGGVDSAVTALLLLQQGHEVSAVHIQMDDRNDHDKESAVEKICAHLGIQLTYLDAKDAFSALVQSYFVRSYLSAMTPNPCVVCNPEVKFATLLRHAGQIGADKVATGHYARIVTTSSGRTFLLKATDCWKDQTYFLHRLPREVLGRVLFPLANLTKEEVRRMAQDHGLERLVEEESQEICFLKERDYRAFVQEVGMDLDPAMERLTRPGPIIDPEGRVIGHHKGLFRYTVGQRRGLGIPDSQPWYVEALDVEANALKVCRKDRLYREQAEVEEVNLLVDYHEGIFSRCRVKIRYRSSAAPAEVVPVQGGRKWRIRFFEPQRAVTPGQFAVFYKGPVVLGGGRICA